MSIKTASAPEQSLTALHTTIDRWVNEPASAPQAVSAGVNFATDEGIEVRLPHPVYDLALQDLAAGKGLGAARIVSWRYLLTDGQVTISAEVSAPANNAPHQLALLNRGPFVNSFVSTVDSAEKDTGIAVGDYEIALISIPGLYVMALWLRAPQTGKGAVIPLAPAPPELAAGRH
ncbi:MAG: hypothetical protein ACRD9L_10225 [Bryobacteraceae bacterium]